MLAPDRLRLVPSHLARRDAPRFLEPLNPLDRRADPNAEPRRCLVPGKPFHLNCRNHALSKIHGVRFRHRRLAPKSSPILESQTQHLVKPKAPPAADSAISHPALGRRMRFLSPTK